MRSKYRTALGDAVLVGIPAGLFGIWYGAVAVAAGIPAWAAWLASFALFVAIVQVATGGKALAALRPGCNPAALAILVLWSGGAAVGACFATGLH